MDSHNCPPSEFSGLFIEQRANNHSGGHANNSNRHRTNHCSDNNHDHVNHNHINNTTDDYVNHNCNHNTASLQAGGSSTCRHT